MASDSFVGDGLVDSPYYELLRKYEAALVTIKYLSELLQAEIDARDYACNDDDNYLDL